MEIIMNWISFCMALALTGCCASKLAQSPPDTPEAAQLLPETTEAPQAVLAAADEPQSLAVVDYSNEDTPDTDDTWNAGQDTSRTLGACTAVAVTLLTGCSITPMIIPDTSKPSLAAKIMEKGLETDPTPSNTWILWYIPIVIVVLSWTYWYYFSSRKEKK